MKTRASEFSWILLTVCVSGIFPASAPAQAPRPQPRLSLRYTVSPVSGSHADSLTLRMRVELPSGWHINSEAPPDSFLVPTKVDAEAKGIPFGKPVFPAPQLVFSTAMGEKLPLYSGAFEVEIPVRRHAGDLPKTLPATRATLHYQACNDAMCLPPKDVTADLAEGVAGK